MRVIHILGPVVGILIGGGVLAGVNYQATDTPSPTPISTPSVYTPSPDYNTTPERTTPVLAGDDNQDGILTPDEQGWDGTGPYDNPGPNHPADHPNEGDPGWDCHTMGNHICGPGH